MMEAHTSQRPGDKARIPIFATVASRGLGRVIEPLLVCAIALITHLFFIAAYRHFAAPRPDPDLVYFYEPLTRSMLAGKGFIMPNGALELRYPPGTSLWLAATYYSAAALHISEASAVRVERAAMAVLLALLIYMVVTRTIGRQHAFWAAIIVAIYPFQLVLTNGPDNTHPFTLLMLLAVYLFIAACSRPGLPRPSGFFWIGALIGLAGIFRPIGIGLGAVFLAALLFTSARRSWQRYLACAVVLIAGNMAAILPWEIWAHNMSGKWIPLSTSGPMSLRDGLTFGLMRGERLSDSLPASVQAIAIKLNGRRDELNTSASIGALLLQSFKDSPGGVATLVAVKAGRSWYATNSERYDRWTALIQAPIVLIGIAGIALARRTRTCPPFVLCLVILLILYLWCMTILALSILRYMIPAMVFLLPFDALAISALVAGSPSGRK